MRHACLLFYKIYASPGNRTKIKVVTAVEKIEIAILHTATCLYPSLKDTPAEAMEMIAAPVYGIHSKVVVAITAVL